MERTGEAARSYPAWVTRFARLLLRVFFGRIEVVGAASGLDGDSVPGAGREPARPLLYVANHNNGLVDPLLVLGLLPGRPRFLAKDTLWKNPVLRPFLALGRVIPIYRPQDARRRAAGEGGGAPGSANEESFRRCREVLEGGGAVALFPEGKSHSEPSLAELKTGAARILLGLDAATRERVAVVPVGLVYDAPGIFRSRVLVAVGEPLLGDELRLEGGPRDAGAVRRVTEKIADGLEDVTLSHASWDEARRLARVADLWLQPDPELPTQPSLAERFAARRRLLARYRELSASRPERLQPLVEAVAAYDARLSALGLRDAQVGAAYPLPSVLRFLVESLVLLLIRLPLTIVGIVLDYVPYRICGFLGALSAKEPDQPATFKLFGGIVLFPLFWAGEAAYAGWRWSWPAALGVLVLGPLAGWVAIRFRDRLRFLRNEARAFVVLERPRSSGDELRGLRAAARRELLALAKEVGETPPA